MNLQTLSFNEQYRQFFNEDDMGGNAFYLSKLPRTLVECHLKIKSDVLLSGLPYFCGAFEFLGAKLPFDHFKKYEGLNFKKGEVIQFELPFNVALTGERVALNLLQHSTRISTHTQKFIEKTKHTDIKILDTRKTTPGLRTIEKYAVRTAGAFNHRFSQSDAWMIKDNHKTFFGGLQPAWDYFKNMQTFYQNIIVEIHSLEELKLAKDLGVKHVMLDNFSLNDLKSAIGMKSSAITFEISGGVTLENIDQYLLPGIDAISIGALTHSAPHVDLSMKINTQQAGLK